MTFRISSIKRKSRSWDAIGGVGYGLNWGAVEVRYRYLEWQLGSDYIVEKLNYSGPVAMVKFYF